MKISVITVTKNNKNGLFCAIESVRSQSYPNIEHVIVDGNSTDGTLDILRQAQDDRTVIISEKDDGIYDAINKGIAISTGDVIGFLHSDDLFNNGTVLESIMKNIEKEKTDSIYGDLVYVNAVNTDNVLRYWKAGEPSNIKRDDKGIAGAMMKGWMPPHPALFVKKAIYDKHGLYDTSLKISSDYEMILRLFWKYKISTAYLPKIITKMRWGGASNKNFSNLVIKSKEDYAAMKKNDLPLRSFALVLKNIRKLPQFISNGYN